MKNLLIVGGTGFIGYHLLKEAQKRKYNVSSISLNRPQKIRYLKGVKYILADISNYKILKKKLNTSFNFVINAGGYGVHPEFGKEGDRLIYSHFQGLQNLLQILNLKKIKKFVQIGSSAEYGKILSPIKETAFCKPKTPYAIAKFLCTKYLMELYTEIKFPTTVFRLFQVYGPKQDDNRIVSFLIKNCLKNKKFLTTEGKQICDFCYIDDVVNAIFKSINNKKTNGEILNIGSGKPISIKKVINLVLKKTGKGMPKLGGLNYKKNINKNNFPNIAKAKKRLRWEPKISIDHGIIKTIKSFK